MDIVNFVSGTDQLPANQMVMPDRRDGSSEKFQILAIQKQRGAEPCFLTDKRYSCNEICEWSASCKKLRAVWLR